MQGNGYIDYPPPLKADDILDDDLIWVSDAVELEELVEDTAARCGRDLCGIEENPFLPIVTVGSLVRVLNAQPMTQSDVTSSLSGHKNACSYYGAGVKTGLYDNKWVLHSTLCPWCLMRHKRHLSVDDKHRKRLCVIPEFMRH